MGQKADTSPYLVGKLLLATPSMGDPRFRKSVIFICAHDENGAMGLVINHRLPGLEFQSIPIVGPGFEPCYPAIYPVAEGFVFRFLPGLEIFKFANIRHGFTPPLIVDFRPLIHHKSAIYRQTLASDEIRSVRH